MTLTEITNALEAGCEMVKLFPGSVLGQTTLLQSKDHYRMFQSW